MKEDGGECQRGGARPRAGAGVEERDDWELCRASAAKLGRATVTVWTGNADEPATCRSNRVGPTMRGTALVATPTAAEAAVEAIDSLG